jgi:hypothetical protein
MEDIDGLSVYGHFSSQCQHLKGIGRRQQELTTEFDEVPDMF